MSSASLFRVLTVILLGFILVTQIVQFGQQDLRRAEDLAWQQSVDSTLAAQNYKDSLYWAHLGNCGFLPKDDIKTDSRGYLYSQHIKSNGLK